jgi:Large polyvalent protein associated domain 29
MNRQGKREMTTYISVTETAKIIRAELKQNFPGIKFSVKSSSYAGGASIGVRWTDGPSNTAVEKVVKVFEGSTFDGSIDLRSYHSSTLNGEEVHFGADHVSCSRTMTRNFVEAIIAQFSQRWGYSPASIKVNGNDQSAYVDVYALPYGQQHKLYELLHGTDTKDMYRAYAAQDEQEAREHAEWEAGATKTGTERAGRLQAYTKSGFVIEVCCALASRTSNQCNPV